MILRGAVDLASIKLKLDGLIGTSIQIQSMKTI